MRIKPKKPKIINKKAYNNKKIVNFQEELLDKISRKIDKLKQKIEFIESNEK